MKYKTETAFPWTHGDAGMTLRDYFAAKAMVAFIDKEEWQSTVGDVSENVAYNSYAMADAMLKARE
jgi:predicted membrane-bound spermidine synthase